MSALRRILRGMLVAAVAAGFAFVPAGHAEATSSERVTPACPDQGWYYMYNEDDELIGVMHVGENCETRVWWA